MITNEYPKFGDHEFSELPVAKKVNAFDAQFSDGEEVLFLQEHRWNFHASGASRDGNPLGLLKPPSEDPNQRAKDILFYWEQRLQRAQTKFDEQRTSFIVSSKANLNAQYCAAPPTTVKEAKEIILGLKEDVLRCQHKVDEARKQVEATKPEYIRKREEADAKNRQQNEMFVAEMMKIEV